MVKGPWWATVHRVAKSQTRLEQLHLISSHLNEYLGVLKHFILMEI